MESVSNLSHSAANSMPALPASHQDLSADTQQIARAMALLWTGRSRAAILNLLHALGWRRGDGRPFGLDDLKPAFDELGRQGLMAEPAGREGLLGLADKVRSALYGEVLAEYMALDLQKALFGLEKFRLDEAVDEWPTVDPAASVGILRLAVFSGMPAERLRRLLDALGKRLDADAILQEAVFAALDPDLLRRIDTEWRRELLLRAVRGVGDGWLAAYLPAAEWLLAQAEAGAPEIDETARSALAEMLLLRGETDRARNLIADLDDGTADGLRAALLTQAGNYAAATDAFETALRRRQEESGARKRLLPESIAWLYPLALLAQGTPTHLQSARKFCQGEAGERSPSPDTPWGLWVHAIEAHDGEAQLDKDAFHPHPARTPSQAELWRLMLAAWLGADRLGIAKGAAAESVAALNRNLLACRLDWLAGQAEAALAVISGRPPASPFFVAMPEAGWRKMLTALTALGNEPAESDAAGEVSRLLWSLRLGERGELLGVEPMEQRHGSRGWSKPKPASLAKVAADDKLPPHDLAVAHAIRPDSEQAGRYAIDLAAAALALVGHPAVALADDLEQLIELAPGQPEIEVVRQGEGYVLRVEPPLRPDNDEVSGITLVQDSPQRVRLVRFSPAQRRVAQLLNEDFVVPAAGREELQQALQALAAHFPVQGEQARAPRQLESESRLHAELAPVGEDLLLRLVVAPLGTSGPRLAPGRGRSRLMANLDGETVSARRDLQAERRYLESVLDALDFLDEPDESDAGCEWLVTDPEAALDMVERLPALPAIASVDWPKGQHLRVVSVDRPQLSVQVSGHGHWFHIDGKANLGAGAMLRLNELLEAARRDSRFIPMGEGVYAALTRSLKQRLNELAALVEPDGKHLRLPRLACAWLEDLLQGAHLRADADFQDATERLRRAQETEIGPPRGLRAELRPYQEEGYRWAMRLAAAGFGGCLADDMGLGKTLQTLALLATRAQGGPALILVPTSLSGNWRAEAERFAPQLDVRVYGENEREASLLEIGPGIVIVASYTLFLMDQERFAGIRWHTVIADEAQAIKNASTKRAVAAFELEADFRLALSGTPLENRLAELWSIMNFANPGLLGNLSHFTTVFATPVEKNQDRQARQRLRRLIAPFILRRTKAQVLDELPPRTEEQITVEPDEMEAAHYEQLRRQAEVEADRALAESPDQARVNILAQLTRLRRAACDPRLTTPEFEAPGAKVRAFAELARNLVDNGHRALVFSQFVDFLALLRQALEENDVSCQYLDGATPSAERTQRVAAFQAGEGEVFLISLKAGGYGLNLTAADFVIITDPWWNPAAEDQAMGRAHRIGQQRPVTVYRLVSRGTVEERILELHRDKRALAESMLEGGEAAPLPATEDLIALLRQSRAAPF